MTLDINKVKIAAASIAPCEHLDEFAANMLLISVLDDLMVALDNDLEMVQARVMSDSGDYFTYLELDIPNGTSPDDAHRALMEKYYESGEYGPDSYILSVRGITKDGKFWEIPFRGDSPAGSKIGYWLGVRVKHGQSVTSPEEVWTPVSLKYLIKHS